MLLSLEIQFNFKLYKINPLEWKMDLLDPLNSKFLCKKYKKFIFFILHL